MRRSTLAFVLTTVLLLAAPGCSDDESARSVVTIEQINGNQTLDSDVYNNGDDDEYLTGDDYVVEDQIQILVRNRPHDVGLDIEGTGAFGAVVFDRYEVRFEGEEVLPPLFGAIHLRVASGSTATGEITVIPAAYKVVEPLRSLRENVVEMRFIANVKLIGTEVDSNEEITASAKLPVHCANWGDTDD